MIDLRKLFNAGGYFDVAGDMGKYPFLDALRAFAILWVMIRHWVAAAHESFGGEFLEDNFFLRLCNNGWIGVDLFFVLSGFLIADHFLRVHNLNIAKIYIYKFYIRRAFRTLPLYWGVIVLCWVIAELDGHPVASLFSFSTHFLFLQDYLGSDTLITLWSLAVEEKFYILAPLLVVFLRKKGFFFLLAGIFCLFVSMLISVSINSPKSYQEFFWAVRAPFHHAVIAILIGVLVALCKKNRIFYKVNLRCCKILFFSILCIIIFLHGASDWIRVEKWYLVCFVILFSSFLFGALIQLGLIFAEYNYLIGSSRGLRKIAKLSYALYLIHYPLIPFSLALTQILFESMTFLDLTWRSTAFLSIYTITSFLSAILIHLTLEKPFLLLRERFFYH